MTCIDRSPRCGEVSSSGTPTGDIIAAIILIFGIIGGIVSIVKFLGDAAAIAKLISFFGSVAGAGAVSGALAAIAMGVLVTLYALDRCVQGEGQRDICVAGVITHVEHSFSSTLDEIFPFSAMHDRVDVVVKSRFWDIVEDTNAFVHCTDHAPPRKSAIQRCYYYEERVCKAASAAVTGAAVGAAAGIIAAALVAAAIGCATVIFCILALIVAALVAAAVTLAGAFVGGQIGKATEEDESPASSGGQAIQVGDLISVRGPRQLRDHDEGAGVIWWVSGTDLHGRVADGTPTPFSYCEVNDQLTTETCPGDVILRENEEPEGDPLH